MMIVVLMKTGFAIGVPIFTGYAFIRAFFKKGGLPFALSLALSYGLGMGILTLWMLLLAILKIPFEAHVIATPLLLLACALIYTAAKSKQEDQRLFPYTKCAPMSSQLNILCGIGLGYTALIVFYVLWRSFNIPIREWDAISFISYKAKVFFYEQELFHHKELPHPSYPLHVSLAQTWIALCLNHWHDTLVKIIFPSYFISFLIIVYHFLRCWTDRLWSLLGVVLILSSNFFVFHATIAYKDFTVMFYNCTAIMLLMLWHRLNWTAFLILAALFAGISSFIKNEAALYLCIYFALLIIILIGKNKSTFKDKAKHFFMFIIPSVFICSIYQTYRILAGVQIKTYDTNLEFSLNQLNRIPGILFMFMNNLMTSAGWNFVWFLFFLSILQLKKIIRNRDLIYMVLAPLAFFALYFIGLLVSPQYNFFKEVSQHTVLSRVFLHFFPLSALVIVLTTCPHTYTRRASDHS